MFDDGQRESLVFVVVVSGARLRSVSFGAAVELWTFSLPLYSMVSLVLMAEAAVGWNSIPGSCSPSSG